MVQLVKYVPSGVSVKCFPSGVVRQVFSVKCLSSALIVKYFPFVCCSSRYLVSNVRHFRAGGVFRQQGNFVAHICLRISKQIEYSTSVRRIMIMVIWIANIMITMNVIMKMAIVVVFVVASAVVVVVVVIVAVVVVVIVVAVVIVVV